MNSFIKLTQSKISNTNKAKYITLIIICISTSNLIGCGSIMTRTRSHPVGTEFIATQCSVNILAISSISAFTVPLIPIAMVDTGLSLAMDTVLLPVDLATPRDPKFRSGNPCGIGALTP